jgi:hypothetical protein
MLFDNGTAGPGVCGAIYCHFQQNLWQSNTDFPLLLLRLLSRRAKKNEEIAFLWSEMRDEIVKRDTRSKRMEGKKKTLKIRKTVVDRSSGFCKFWDRFNEDICFTN